MGELFLSGGGNAEQIREVNEFFIQKIDPVKPLLYINLINGHSVWCHYQEKSDLKLYEYVDCLDIPIIAIPEGTAVYATPYKLSVLGLEEAYLFDKENIAVIEKV